MSNVRSGGGMVLTMLLLFSLREARGQGPAAGSTNQDDFMRHFEQGQRLYLARQVEGALREFDAAYDIRPDPRVQCLRGHALLHLRRPEEALGAYEHCQEARDLSPDEEEQVRRSMGRARALARVHKDVEGPGPSGQEPGKPGDLGKSGEPGEPGEPDKIDQGPPPPSSPVHPPLALRLPLSQGPRSIRKTPLSRVPFYKKGWFWATVGAVAATGIVTGAVLGTQLRPAPLCPSDPTLICLPKSM